MASEHNIIHLARTFPTLRTAPLSDDFDAAAFDRWAAGPEPGESARHAAAFILSVWDAGNGWPHRRVRTELLREWRRAVDAALGWLEEQIAIEEHSKTAEGTRARFLRNAVRALEEASKAYARGELRRAAELVHNYHPVLPFAELRVCLHHEALGPSLTVAQALKMIADAENWLVGPFDLGVALQQWDKAHRAAFLAWAKDPWWC